MSPQSCDFTVIVYTTNRDWRNDAILTAIVVTATRMYSFNRYDHTSEFRLNSCLHPEGADFVPQMRILAENGPVTEEEREMFLGLVADE